MSYTKEMKQAEVAQAAGTLGKVLKQWGITEQVNADGTGSLTDSKRGGLPPARLDYVCDAKDDAMTITRITEGKTTIFNAYEKDPANDVQMVIDDFLTRNPQIEAVLVVRDASIPYSPLVPKTPHGNCQTPRR